MFLSWQDLLIQNFIVMLQATKKIPQIWCLTLRELEYLLQRKAILIKLKATKEAADEFNDEDEVGPAHHLTPR